MLHTYELGQPLTLVGFIKQSNIVKPTSSLLRAKEEYAVTIELEEPYLQWDLSSLFDQHRGQLPSVNQDWNSDLGVVTAKSLIQPRIKYGSDVVEQGELSANTLVSIDCRPSIKELDGVEYHSLVLISINADFGVEEIGEDEIDAHTLEMEALYGELNF